MVKVILTLGLLFGFIFASEKKEVIKVCYLEWGKLGGKELPNT